MESWGEEGGPLIPLAPRGETEIVELGPWAPLPTFKGWTHVNAAPN